MKTFEYNAETKTATFFSHDMDGKVLFTLYESDFSAAYELSYAFDKIYKEGLDLGKRRAIESIKKSLEDLWLV